MSKIIATLVASLFAATAFAQTGGVPPAQAPAGTAVQQKQEAKADAKPLSDKKEAALAKRKARTAKRAAKVGDKPLN